MYLSNLAKIGQGVANLLTIANRHFYRKITPSLIPQETRPETVSNGHHTA